MFSQAVAKYFSWFGLCAALQLSAAAELGSAPSGHVLVVENPRATQAFTPQAEVVRQMVREGIERFSGAASPRQAWDGLVSTQDVVGIKVHSAPGRMSGTRPAVVGALVETLLEAGIPPRQIVLWDRRSVDLRLAGYYELAERFGINIASALDEGYDREVSYMAPLLGRLVYGDLEFGEKGEGIGRNSHVSRLLTRRLTKLINVTPLLNHGAAGVSGALHGLVMGSVDNILRFDDSPARLATAVPEIYAMPELADRVVLNVMDALICQYRGEERSFLHYSTPLNQLWFSRDPVAIDVFGIQQLERFRKDESARKRAMQIYTNAELMELGAADPAAIKIERRELK